MVSRPLSALRTAPGLGVAMGTTLRNAFLLILFGLVAFKGVERLGDHARDMSAADAEGEGIARIAARSPGGSGPEAHRETHGDTYGDTYGGSADELVLRAGRNGHFTVEARVDGIDIDFLVDTGASLVILGPDDAERLGLWPNTLDYTVVFDTANGRARAAPVVLRELRIGPIELDDVRAAVMEAPIATPLLGMSALGRLPGYQVDGDRMILRW